MSTEIGNRTHIQSAAGRADPWHDNTADSRYAPGVFDPEDPLLPGWSEFNHAKTRLLAKMAADAKNLGSGTRSGASERREHEHRTSVRADTRTHDTWGLEGRAAIVTGASSGLGVEFARGLAAAGARVVLAARRQDRLERVEQSIRDAGGECHVVRCDVAESSQVGTMVAECVARYGSLDIMVANAGIAGDAGPMPERLPDPLFEETVRVNLIGTWYCMRAAGAQMLAQGSGSVIAVSSVAGLGGQQCFPPAYQATKAGVINLTRNLALSWADRGVRVNALAPGWFPSEMTGPFIEAPIFGDRILTQQPMGRVGDPRELVGPLLFLASDASSYVTGHTLVVDGGMSASCGHARYDEQLYGFHASIVPDGLGERIFPEESWSQARRST